MIGWPSAPRPNEREFILAPARDLPEFGRLTGRDDTANVEIVIKAKPDLVFDFGSVSPTYVSLAERVQEQTGIPCHRRNALGDLPHAGDRRGHAVGPAVRAGVGEE